MKPLLLIVLDGWGIAPPGKGNAILRANPKYFLKLKQENPYCKLHASGKHVGLLPGKMGNSEVGHMHIGAGRLVKQDLAKIHEAIKNGSFFKNKALVNAVKNCKRLHLIGLLSDAGVHAHIKHLQALIKLAKKHDVDEIYVHALTDGRDMPPKSAEKMLRKIRGAKIATLQGRYYGMDRDRRWNRTQKGYDAIVKGKGRKAENWQDALKKAYTKKETDEFIKPTVIDKKGTVKDGDTVIFFNFRSDRAKQLTMAFTQKKFDKFKRKKVKTDFVAFTHYAEWLKTKVAFPTEKLKNTLGEVISKQKLSQYRLAETEKWSHVTFFFNGLTDKKFAKEERLLIPSPKVTTYDKKPEMSAYKIADALVKALKKGKYGFILVNFANADMVGHNGSIPATIKAVKAVDNCLEKVIPVATEKKYDVIITADHGNAEQKLYPDGTICTSHTTNKVPMIVLSDRKVKLKNGALYNIAPTVLKLIGIKKPKEMKAKPLF